MESFADFETEDCEIDVTFGIVHEGPPVIPSGLKVVSLNIQTVQYTSYNPFT